MAAASAAAEANGERKAKILVRDNASKLLAVLKEMKDGLDLVRGKVEAITRKNHPIDKKAEYQIQKLTNAVDGATAREKAGSTEAKGKGEHSDEEDLLKYRSNPRYDEHKVCS